jgi:hypothetical protein
VGWVNGSEFNLVNANNINLSQINVMTFDRASKTEYDGRYTREHRTLLGLFMHFFIAWAELGNPGWDWNGRPSLYISLII